MPALCSKEHCFVLDDRCLMGEDDPKTCEFFNLETPNEASTEVAATTPALPWGGNAFGLADLSYLASLSRPRLVGIIGPHNAGKTTLLATIYLLLHRGDGPIAATFSRSLTLGGWEAIATNLRFDGWSGPTFPAHTTMREARVPGLLHLGLRNRQTDGLLNDLVISDAPGEWFRRWAINEAASDVQGARWIAEKSDGFIIVLDSGALSGSGSGATLNIYQQIFERVKKHAGQRPIHIVWTKSDIQMPAEIRARLQERLEAIFPDAPASSVSIKSLSEDESVRSKYMDLLKWMLSLNKASRGPIEKARRTNDPFLCYR